nr:Ldh family oxidoreductase [Halalkalibacter oceani]
MEEYLHRLFLYAGLNEREATSSAHHLVYANLRGVDTHGLQRVPIYIERIKKGGIKKNVTPSIERETPVSALVNGHGGIGPYVGDWALEIAIEKAKTTGIGAVGVYHSNHNGMMAYYTEKAVKQDLIAFVTTTGEAVMAPYGGKKKHLSVSPISYGFPADEEQPFLLDMATGVVARGKIIMALKNNESIPLGWAIDKEGKDTTDPAKALDDGLILPLGGPKGSGLAFMADIFSNILTGANWGPHIHSLYHTPDTPQGNGQFFMIMRPDLFMDTEQFKKRMDQAIREVRSVEKAEGFEHIYIPGEMEAQTQNVRRKNGIPVRKELMEELQQAGQSVGLEENLFSPYYQAGGD